MHAKDLIKLFFDEKPLKRQLVAAYLVGTKILPNEFKTIQPMSKPDEFGGFVSWNSFKMGKFPKNYNEWFAGGVTTNPITWDNSKNSLKKQHNGLLSKDLNLYPEISGISLREEIAKLHNLEKDMISKILALIMAGSIAAMMMWIGSEVRTYEGWVMIGGTFLSGLYTHWLWGFVTSDELGSRHR